MLFGSRSALWPELSFRCIYIFFIYYIFHLIYFCNDIYGLSAFVGWWSSVFIRRIIYKCLGACPFLSHSFWRFCPVTLRFELFCWYKGVCNMTELDRTPVRWLLSRPKSVHHRCVIERFCRVFVLLWLWIVHRSDVFAIWLRHKFPLKTI